MDLESTFNDVLSLAQRAVSAGAGWASLLRYLEDRSGESLRRLSGVDVEHDVQNVRRQLQKLLSSEPPPSDLNAIYFGLFDALYDNGAEALGYYICGVKDFDPTNDDSLYNPAWFPEGRFLTSETLNAITDAELSARTNDQTDLRALLGYAGQLGAGLLVSKFASAGLFPGRHCVVGFDAGDYGVL